MIIRRQRVVSWVVLLLIFSISRLYIQASLTTPSTQAQSVSTSPIPMVGRLEVHGGKHILVDNNDAESGTTILDGQTLETTDCQSATVHLLPVGPVSGAVNEIGEVELATKTRAVVNYSAGKVNVTLVRGCARVGIAQAMETTIVTPDGSSTPATRQGTTNLNHAEVCFPSRENRDYRPACVAPVVWIGAAGALTALAVFVHCHGGHDPSHHQPPGPCH